MSQNREAWQPLLAALQVRNKDAQAMGGEDRIARQHARNRGTARERLNALFDPGSFNEIGALAGGNHPAGEPPVPADGLVGGSGRLQGRSVVALAEDFTVKGGSIGHPNATKRARLVRMAAEQKIPLVLMLDGAGERAGNGSERYPVAPGDLQLVADLKGQVPVVTMIMGTSAGHGALTGMFADLIIMTEGSALFTAGPPLVQASLGIEATPEELGSARMHTSQSGVAHNLAATEADAIAMARYFLSMLPQQAGAELPVLQSSAATASRELDVLLDLIPPQVNQPFDMRELLYQLVDEKTLFELQPGYGGSIITALARIGGAPCLVVANQPTVLAGAITVDSADKASHFIEVATQFGLPLVSLLDNPGVMPGPASEQAGVLKAAGGMFAAQRRHRGKKIVVTLRKAFGFGSSVMGMNPWDRQTISLALPSANLGGIPAIGGAQAAQASETETLQMQKAQSGAWVPADAMAFDKIIAPQALRNEIMAALRL